jgi:hypothetical protein
VATPRVVGYSVRRYYDPGTGQFISVDPLVDQTLTPYAYVDGNPVNMSDPLGLGGWSWNPVSDAETAYHGLAHAGESAGSGLASFAHADATGLKEEWSWAKHALGQIKYNVVGTWDQLPTTGCEIAHNPGAFAASAAGYSLGLIFVAGGFLVGGEILGSEAPGLLAAISHPADALLGGGGVTLGGIGPFAIGVIGSEELANR